MPFQSEAYLELPLLQDEASVMLAGSVWSLPPGGSRYCSDTKPSGASGTGQSEEEADAGREGGGVSQTAPLRAR